jgi:hypothetical protein
MGKGSSPQQQVVSTGLPDYVDPYFKRLLKGAEEATMPYYPDDPNKYGDLAGKSTYVPYEGDRLTSSADYGDITQSRDMIRNIATSPLAGMTTAVGTQNEGIAGLRNLALNAPSFTASNFSATGVNPYSGFQAGSADPYSGFAASPATAFTGFQAGSADPYNRFDRSSVTGYGGFQERQADPFSDFDRSSVEAYGGFQAGQADPFSDFTQAEFSKAQGKEFDFGPARQFTGAEVSDYMDPYMQNVVDVQKREAIRDFGRGQAGRDAAAVTAGAFGGSRQAVAQGMAEQNLDQRLGDIQQIGSQAAFDRAMQMFESDRAAQMDVDQRRAAEAARVQGIDVGETGRTQTGTAAEMARTQAGRAAELARTQGISLDEAARIQAAEASELARTQGVDVSEAARTQAARAAELARTQGISIDEARRIQAAEAAELARTQGVDVSEAARTQAAEAAELARTQGISLDEAARIQAANAAEQARVQGLDASEAGRIQAAQAAELARTQGISIDEAARIQAAQAAELARTQGIDVSEAARVQSANAAEQARIQAALEAQRYGTAGLYGDLMGAGRGLLGLGELARGTDIQGAQLLETLGRDIRGEDQARLDLAYQDFLRQQDYPISQYERFAGLLSGVPTGNLDRTTTQYASYNPIQQALGAGISALGLYRGLGGGYGGYGGYGYGGMQ